MSFVPTNVSVEDSDECATQPSCTGYAALQRAIELHCGRSIGSDEFPFQFSGLDYAIVLMAANGVPHTVKVRMQNALCWSDAPNTSQLLDNLSVFVDAARSLVEAGGLCSEEAAMCVSKSLHPSALQPCPANLANHIAVQRWLVYSAVAAQGPCELFDPVALRREMRNRLDSSWASTTTEDDVVLQCSTCRHQRTMCEEHIQRLRAQLEQVRQYVTGADVKGGGRSTIDMKKVLEMVRP